MYLSKETILKAYQVLADSKPKQLGSFSALQYFIATDRFYKIFNRPCESSSSEDKKQFYSFVEEVVLLDDNHYLSTFKQIYKGNKSVASTVSSNFFNGSSVEHSNKAKTQPFDYPSKGALIYALAGNVYIKDEYYSNLSEYLSKDEEKVALAIWLLRKNGKFNSFTLDELKAILGNIYTPKMVETLLPITELEWSSIKDSLPVEGNSEIVSIEIGDITGNKSGNSMIKYSQQTIFYGTPGTGKSFRVNEDTKGEAVIRTTFHPDSDYSTFVGAYKPTMGKGRVYGAQGPLQEKIDGKTIDVEEPKIVYEFVMQAFLKAYLGAWKKYSENRNTPKPQFLVIEEINRGNCAQIFGDLFQLLDRSDNGFSTYPIEADTDLQMIISKKFKEEGGLYKLNDDFNVDDKVEDYTSNYDATLTDDIKDGRVLLLPKNLYIWATMNTSDQSLFPIDSAFKRRWDWEYIPIDKGYDQNGNELDWCININGEIYNWWGFLQVVNNEIFENTHSEDKQLGYYFCKADNNEISPEKFVSKIVFYLWNDVFKDFEGNKVFGSLKFSDFYEIQGNKVSINIKTIKQFLQGLKIDPVSEITVENGKPCNKKRLMKVQDIIARINEIGPEILVADQELMKFKVQGGVDLIGTQEILKDNLLNANEETYRKYRSEQYSLNNGYYLALYGLYNQQLDDIRAILSNR